MGQKGYSQSYHLVYALCDLRNTHVRRALPKIHRTVSSLINHQRRKSLNRLRILPVHPR
jgi:hypothetical protein